MWQHLENRVEWGLWDLELMSVVMGDEVVDLGEVLLVINQSSQRAYSLTFMIDVIYIRPVIYFILFSLNISKDVPRRRGYNLYADSLSSSSPNICHNK